MPPQGVFLTELAGPYLESRRVHLAASTWTQERRHLERFLSSLKAQGVDVVGGVVGENLARYHAELCLHTNRQGRRVSGSFLQQAMLVVRGFLVWARKSGLLLWDFSDFPIPKRADHLPIVPTAEAMRQLLELPDVARPVGLRDRLILELLYVLGMRAGECTALNLDSADLAARTLVVVGKGGHQRMLPLSPSPYEALCRYLDEARPLLKPKAGERALLLSRLGRRLGGQSVLLRVRGYGDKLSLKLTAHQLRHGCATHLLEGGAELPYISQLLGHAGLGPTQRYALMRPLELAKEHRRCHPRSIGGPP
jgi:site-specific recombinase XerD